MSNEELKLRICKNALDATNIKLALVPETLRPMYLTIQAQLSFLVDFFNGVNNQHARLHELNFGHIAVREIENSDPEYAHLLKLAFYVAYQTGLGVKLDQRFIIEHT